jgi:hypothetical protein
MRTIMGRKSPLAMMLEVREHLFVKALALNLIGSSMAREPCPSTTD